MLSFECDYSEGCLDEILTALAQSNMRQCPGYLQDPFCRSAADKIRAACDCPEAEVFFITGGTQTNAAVISAVLKRHEGVVSADTGHVGVHEAGAIEYTGHKVLTIKHRDGKLDAADLKDHLETFYADGSFEHMVFPGMVYISQPTEYGTVYTKRELEALRRICDEYSLPLYADGARLGYALASPECDVSLSDMARLCDVFYIGGTKVGALCGEAVVFTRKAPAHFFTMIKQQGALIAKGRLLGVQFDALFTDDLYLRASRHALKQAEKIRALLAAHGFKTYIRNSTNQIFIIMPNDLLRKLLKRVAVSFWEKYDAEHTVVRFATSWATTDESVEALKEILESLKQKP